MHAIRSLLGATSRWASVLKAGRISCSHNATQLIQSNERKRTLLTESYSQGPSNPPLLTQTIPQHFADIVSKYGDRTAVISKQQNVRLTYRDLDEKSNSLARGLREEGVLKGDRVAVMLGNNWEFAVATYALFKLGAILVPLNPAFNSAQVISALNHLEAGYLIISLETSLPYKEQGRENISLLTDLGLPNHWLPSEHTHKWTVPSLQKIILTRSSKWDHYVYTYPEFDATYCQLQSLVRKEEEMVDIPVCVLDHLIVCHDRESSKSIIPDSPLHMDDTINIQFTSGTTSAPKAACLSHNSILNNGYFIGERMGLTSQDIVCCPPPLFHCFGCILGYMATATHGSAILFPSEAFSPSTVLRSVQEEKATALYGVATMFIAELELLANGTISPTGFEHLRTGIAAGSSVPRHLMEKLHKALNLKGLTICYGMTETSPVSCMTTPTDPIQKRIDSVGRLLPHIDAKVVSVDDHSSIVSPNTRGELVISGYNVMKGYWNDEVRTNEVRVAENILDANGEEVGEKVWMYTGDEAEMDEEGYVKITGRIKDLIIRGGENIHPLEIENCLFTHWGVGEVSVVGIPDEKYGECVAAFIVPRKRLRFEADDAGSRIEEDETVTNAEHALTTQALKDWVRGQLSGHLVPKHIFWINEYPKTASGKIQKFKLKEMGMEILKQNGLV
ncbi:acyl-CoA synthetase/AMP-acid ligase-like protein II [Calycina marina]|uniref:Acyl-CoA synthetase/AMP-acid ligase-like protein II n=1 Tax=Calycina marina TaxID=1763456 RepID=A0A9P7YVR7_9HELO|nr:acyl-CoA synthetase/AMP-acid ligase-like protein II [Calycina marina]